MTIDNELIDNLLKDYKKPEDIIGENGLLKQLTKQLLERAMAAELTEHVGYEKHDAAGHKSGNSRNGKSAKTLKGTFGTMQKDPGYGNRGKTNCFFPPFPQPLLLVTNQDEKQLTLTNRRSFTQNI